MLSDGQAAYGEKIVKGGGCSDRVTDMKQTDWEIVRPA